jgi:hypothetical protein
VLVPTDIGKAEARYFHDVELAYVLKKMEEAKLIVTVILDCCFSGGTTRGREDISIRGRDRNTIDKKPRPGESSVASLPILTQTWRSLPKGSLRGFRWMPARGYVLLAACHAMQYAYEYPHDTYDGHGVFTYWLLDTLHHLGPNTTYRMLYNRVQAKVSSAFERQNPLILGEEDRLVFGSNRRPIEPAATVAPLAGKQEVQLNVGIAHMVEKGATFAIYPPEVSDFSQGELCQAIVKIIHVGDITSFAQIIEVLRPEPIESGAQAILRNPGNILSQQFIHLYYRDELSVSIQQKQALQAVELALQQNQQKFVQLASEDEKANYQIVVNEHGQYEVWDKAGVIIQTLSSPLSISNPHAAKKLVRRLIHATKYRNLARLTNTDADSPLSGKVVFRLLGRQTTYEPGEQPQPEPFAETAGNPTVKPEEWIFLFIRNTFSRSLNVTVFNLAPDWSITQVFPYDETSHTLAPDESYTLDLQAGLPDGMRHGIDILKIFATIGEPDFRYLELPALDTDSGPRRGAQTYQPATPLEELLFALMEEAPDTRTFRPGVRPTREWFTDQIIVDVREE